MLGVQVLSKETIRPSSPTPPHLHSIPLSLLDQTAPKIFTHIILFYSCPDEITTITKSFRSSLSETLAQFYPLAGRIRASEDGTLRVECNDEGAIFSEARVEFTTLSSFLENPSFIDGYPELLAIKESNIELADPLLAVQMTNFECGGLAVALSISHVIADGASMYLFLSAWAAVARGLAVKSVPQFFDAAQVFPPQPVSISTAQEPSPSQTPESKEVHIAIRRFRIAAGDIERLRGEEGRVSTSTRRQLTRVEAVSALAWRCMVRARGEAASGGTTVSLHSVNLRRRMSSKLSDASFGNLWVSGVPTGTSAVGEDGGENWVLEDSIRKAIAEVGEEYANKKAEEMLRGSGNDEKVADDGSNDPLIFSSWCRIPFYRVDFGWGGPVWVGCALRQMRGVCILMDAKDEEGMEVWLWLEEDEMERIEREPEFLRDVSNY